MAKFQPPPIQGQNFLEGSAPAWAWQRWFELVQAALSNPAVPANSGAPGAPASLPGIASDGNYLYICTAANTWKRIALTAF